MSVPVRATVVPLLIALAGCDTTVHVRLSHGGDPLMAQECGLAAGRMGSFYLELVREGDSQELVFKKCINLPGGPSQPTNLGELETLLAGRIVFEDVPPGEEWTIWAEGFSAAECVKSGSPLLCAMESGVKIPPSNGSIVLDVSCAADKISWTSESIQICKEK